MGRELRGAPLIVRHLAVMWPEDVSSVTGRTSSKSIH
jgi:hypothetical protein